MSAGRIPRTMETDTEMAAHRKDTTQSTGKKSAKQFVRRACLLAALLAGGFCPHLRVSAGALTDPVETSLHTGSAAGGEEQVVILHTNDIHAEISGYPALAAYRQELLDAGYAVAVVDAGDAIQGQPVGALTKGEAVAELMDSVPYDLAVPGNHEFDYGMETFLTLAEDRDFPYISCNFVDLRTGETVFAPYEILDLAGHRVAFVGICTPETYTKSTPVYFQDDTGAFVYSFEEDALAARVQAAADAARAEGAECVIAVGHLGITGVETAWSTETLAAKTQGIDAFIDGHDHQVYEDTLTDAAGRQIAHAETGYSFQNIGKLTLSFDGGEVSVTGELVPVSSVRVDEAAPEQVRAAYGALQKMVDDDNAEIAYLSEEIGTSEVSFATLDEDGQWLARYEETPLGDFVADAYRTVLETDIGIVNGGGIRGTGIEAGVLTRMDMLEINPWENEMGVIRATGQEILDYLEIVSDFGWDAKAGHPDPYGSFAQVSGLSYEIDLAGPSPVLLDERGMFRGFDSARSRRIRNVRVGGAPIDPEGSYTVAGSLYVLQNSAKGRAAFAAAPLVRTSDLTDGDILTAYVTDCLPGRTVTAAQYGQAQGRVTVTGYREEAADAPAAGDITAAAWQVIRGDYGNGQARKRRLAESGYDAAAVQREVNRLLAG